MCQLKRVVGVEKGFPYCIGGCPITCTVTVGIQVSLLLFEPGPY